MTIATMPQSANYYYGLTIRLKALQKRKRFAVDKEAKRELDRQIIAVEHEMEMHRSKQPYIASDI